MSDEILDNDMENQEEILDDEQMQQEDAAYHQPPKSDYDPTKMKDSITHHLSGMYQKWFLEYASYVIR